MNTATPGRYQRWSQDEVNLLLRILSQSGRNWGELQREFPTRNVQQIRQKIYQIEGQKSRSQNSISPIYSNDISTRSMNNSLNSTVMQNIQPPFLLNTHAGYHPGWGKVFSLMQ